MSKGAISSFGNRLSRFIIVISALAIGLRLVTKGLMSAERLTVFLVVIVIAAAIDSVWSKLILALFALGFFLLEYVDYDVRQFYALSGSALALLIGLFGIFVMFGGVRRK